MDKLGKQAYNNPNLLYMYRGSVAVPPLQIVDDLITSNKCDPTSVTKHNAVGTFIKLKKLEFGEEKCARIHIPGKDKWGECPKLFINNKQIKESDKENYLGDILTKQANHK